MFIVSFLIGWFMPILILFLATIGLVIAIAIVVFHFTYSLVKGIFFLKKDYEREKRRQKIKEKMRKNLSYLRSI